MVKTFLLCIIIEFVKNKRANLNELNSNWFVQKEIKNETRQFFNARILPPNPA